jgi:hypothetical protein
MRLHEATRQRGFFSLAAGLECIVGKARLKVDGMNMNRGRRLTGES